MLQALNNTCVRVPEQQTILYLKGLKLPLLTILFPFPFALQNVYNINYNVLHILSPLYFQPLSRQLFSEHSPAALY